MDLQKIAMANKKLAQKHSAKCKLMLSYKEHEVQPAKGIKYRELTTLSLGAIDVWGGGVGVLYTLQFSRFMLAQHFPGVMDWYQRPRLQHSCRSLQPGNLV